MIQFRFEFFCFQKSITNSYIIIKTNDSKLNIRISDYTIATVTTLSKELYKATELQIAKNAIKKIVTARQKSKKLY